MGPDHVKWGRTKSRYTRPSDNRFSVPHRLREAFDFCLQGPRIAKTCLRAYADSEFQDQPAHPRCLIRTFTARCQITRFY